MKYYIGIDGGGSKTKFILTDDKGVLLASDQQPTSHYLQVGFDGVTRIIAEGMKNILKKIETKDVLYSFAALPGYGNIAKDAPLIQAAVEKSMHGIPFSIGNDTENALAGSLAGNPGINIVAGTGSIGCGIDENGSMTYAGGWYYMFGGDEGSAYWLACKMLLEFTRQSDGRDERTMLYEHLKKEMQLEDDMDILVRTIQEMKFDRTRIAALASHLKYLADNGDPYAIRFYKEAAKELFEIILAVKNRLDFRDKVKVSYSGGVFKSGEYVTLPLKEYLEKQGMELVTPILSPDAGSIILALKHYKAEITDEIVHNLSAL